MSGIIDGIKNYNINGSGINDGIAGLRQLHYQKLQSNMYRPIDKHIHLIIPIALIFLPITIIISLGSCIVHHFVAENMAKHDLIEKRVELFKTKNFELLNTNYIKDNKYYRYPNTKGMEFCYDAYQNIINSSNYSDEDRKDSNVHWKLIKHILKDQHDENSKTYSKNAS